MAAQALRDADGSHEREDRQVRVSHSPDDKSRRFEASPEVPPAVTAHFVRKNRVIPSEKVERCDVDDEPAARFEHARHFGDCLSLGRVIERVEHVERRHQIEPLRGERQVRRRRARREALAPLPRELQPGPREIDSVRATVAAQPREIVARAATAIEDVEGRSAGGVGNERFNESTEPAEPEMIALGARRRLEEPAHPW